MELKWVGGAKGGAWRTTLLQVEVEQLRVQCADYIERYQKDLLPFLIDPETGETLSEGEQCILVLVLPDVLQKN